MTFSDNKFKWLVMIAVILVYCGTLNHRPLYSPDEIRYALIPAEMSASGNYAVPTLNGLSYCEKPVLGYWLTALSVQLLGDHAFAIRFPSALFTLLTAGVICLLGSRTGNKRLGVCAAALYLCSGLVFAVGTFAVLDPPFVFFTVLGTALWFLSYAGKKDSRQWLCLLGAGLSIGAGVMIKGLLAPLLCGLAILFFCGLKKQYRKFFTSLPLLIAGILLAALPGMIYMHQAIPGFWQEFFWYEHIQRGFFGRGAGDSRLNPWWFYIPVLLIGAMPSLLLFPAGIAAVRKRWKAFLLEDDLMCFSAVCTVIWFLFFSIAAAKLATYILVAFPFLFLLVGGSLLQAEKENTLFIAGRILHWVCVMICCGVIVFLAWHLIPQVPWKFKLYSKQELAAPVMLAGLLLVWYNMASKEKDLFPERKFLYFCIGTGIVMMSVNLVIPRKIQREFDQTGFIRRAVLPRLQPNDLVLADGAMAAAAAWTLKRNVPVYIKPGEFQRGLERAGKRAATPEDLKLLIPAAAKAGGQVVVLTRSANRIREMQGRKTIIRAGKLSAVFFTENK